MKTQKMCKKCGTTQNLLQVHKYQNGVIVKSYDRNICKTCYDYNPGSYAVCSKCQIEKKPSTNSYCNKCMYRVRANKKFKDDISDDYKIEIYLYVRSIIRRNYNIYDIDILKITNYWSDIAYWPHDYWNLDSKEQVSRMWSDLLLFLNIKEKK